MTILHQPGFPNSHIYADSPIGEPRGNQQDSLTLQVVPYGQCESMKERWRLTLNCHCLNEVTPPLNVAVPDMLETQYELVSKADKWHATTDIANTFFSTSLAAECRPHFAFSWRVIQYTWNRLPQVWKRSPAICHGLIQTVLEQEKEQFHVRT